MHANSQAVSMFCTKNTNVILHTRKGIKEFLRKRVVSASALVKQLLWLLKRAGSQYLTRSLKPVVAPLRVRGIHIE